MTSPASTSRKANTAIDDSVDESINTTISDAFNNSFNEEFSPTLDNDQSWTDNSTDIWSSNVGLGNDIVDDGATAVDVDVDADLDLGM